MEQMPQFKSWKSAVDEKLESQGQRNLKKEETKEKGIGIEDIFTLTDKLYIEDEINEDEINKEEEEDFYGKSETVNEEIEKEIISAINKSSEKEYSLFLENHLSIDQKRHELSQKIIDALLEKGLAFYEDKSEKEMDFTQRYTGEPKEIFLHNLVRSFSSSLEEPCFKYFEAGGYCEGRNDESITDKALRASVKFYEKFPQAGYDFFDKIMNNARLMRGDILINEIAGAIGKLDAHFEQSAVKGINSFFAADRPVSMALAEEAIMENLDFDNPDNYSRTGKILDFIAKIYNSGFFGEYDNGYSEEVEGAAMSIISEVLEKNKGSYFLNLRAEEIFEDMEEGEFVRENREKMPFLIQEGRYALAKEGKIYISELKDEGLIKQGLENIVSIEKGFAPPQAEIDKAVLTGKKEASWNINQKLFREMQRSYEEVIKILRPITLEDVSFSRIDKKQEEKEKDSQDLLDYQYLMTVSLRGKIENEFGFKMQDLSLHEQFYFLQFIKNKEAKDIGPTREFVKKYGHGGLKAFLSLDYGIDFGDYILKIGENLETGDAERVFAKYGEIVDATSKVTEYLEEKFGKEKGYDAAVVNEISEKLLRRGMILIADFGQAAGEAAQKGEKLSAGEIGEELEKIKTETMLFLSSFKTLHDKGVDLKLEEIKDVEMFSTEAYLLETEDIAKMKEIYAENYKQYPELQKKLLQSLETALQSDNNRFYIFKHKDEVKGFYRLETQEDSSLYFASFNIDPEYKGSALGEEFMQESLDVEAQDSIIKADSTDIAPICGNYIERGFAAVGHYQFDEVKPLSLVRNDAMNNFFEPKSFNVEEIKKKCVAGEQITDGKFTYFAITSDKISEAPFDLTNMTNKEGNRYVMTRYIRETPQNMVYLVFELVPDKIIAEYSTPRSLREIPLLKAA